MYFRPCSWPFAGNVIATNRGALAHSYTYDVANRMSSFAVNGVVQAQYQYNSLGQQVVRHLTAAGQTIHSVHDAAGNRIAEYDYDAVAGTSTLIREYIWAAGMNVAVVEAGQVYFVRTDHIGRPVFATDDTGAKVWEATYLPFGGVHTSTGPNSSLRFPGQWFQSETGLHQNWMRDYDPTTGRYMQADPLGLVDGASIYGYALQNPGRYTDPTGEAIPALVMAAAYGIVVGYAIDMIWGDGCYTFEEALMDAGLGVAGYGVFKGIGAGWKAWRGGGPAIRGVPPLVRGVTPQLARPALPRVAASSTSASSNVLSKALISNGVQRPAQSAAHHIVAGNAAAAAPARQVLQRFGVGINDAANGVFLPATKNAVNPTGSTVHSTLHTNRYYQKVNTMLSQARSHNDVVNTLSGVLQACFAHTGCQE